MYHYSPRQFRVLLLVLAGLLGCIAIFVKEFRVLPFDDGYAVSGSFRSPLLPEVVSVYDLQATVGAPQFQGVVGAKVSAEPLPNDPHGFRLIVRYPGQMHAEDSFPAAVELLKVKLKSLALSEVEASKAFVEELQQEVLERKETSGDGPPVDRLEASLSEEDGRRALLLRREIQDLKGFLNGGKVPGWLSAELERGSIIRADKKIQHAKSELLRLSTVFQTDSKPVRAQADLLRQAQTEKDNLQKHVSKVLLDSHRAELKRLEDKSLAIVRGNANSKSPSGEKAEQSEPSSVEKGSDASAWLGEHSHKLTEKANQLERQANLTEIDKPTTTVEQPSGYWVSISLWTGCMLSLLAALFTDAPARRNSGTSRDSALADIRMHSVNSPPLDYRPPLQEIAFTSPEPFFQNFQDRLRREMGHLPARVLVLGAGHGHDRSSLSLRLAKNFSNANHVVRLIDFDLMERTLSKRMGDESSPGVSDLLSRSGPVEEFFASVPGTSIQFAPAGTLRVLHEPICEETLGKLLPNPPSGITLVDASFRSPIHLILRQVDAVLCLTSPGTAWSEHEEQVLVALRKAGLPLWGVAQGGSYLYPFI